jgi:hypothetical protein
MFERTKTYFGPLMRTNERLDDGGKQNLKKDFVEMVSGLSVSNDNTIPMENEYLETVARKNL